ncbi:transmembrane protein 132E-like [Oppia nitens]|uniref:transmembrane protein 132E-like n=1 Tax=Oppia nitens TaxID=1686743 RepID=UPI0023DA1A13|nr:transmembrane protein 132E-like [Oppia nitens]
MTMIWQLLCIYIFVSLLTDKCWTHLVIDLESEPESKLFLQDIERSPETETSSQQTDIKFFALVQPSSSVSVRANYGPLTVRQTIYPSYWSDIPTNPRKNESSISNGIQEMVSPVKAPALNRELSAHLVTREVRRSNPVLRVLFYASHTTDFTQRTRIDYIDKKICAAVVVQYHKERLTGTCSPSKTREGACLAEITLPSSYWPPIDINGSLQKQQKATIAKVYYAITHSDHCTEGSVITTSDANSLALNFLSDVSLVPFRGSYEEITNDNVVTILIPQEPVYPNSKIYIPVKFTYNPEYPIAAFSLRVRVKSGVRILGAQLSHSNRLWQLSTEVSPKQNMATVTAFLRDFDVQQDSDSVTDELLETSSQDVYSWLLEIDEEVDINEGGRTVWQLLYVSENSVAVKQDFEKESAKLSSRLDIQKDNVLDVLAITKSHQLLNTALLTGRQVSHAMRIYMVSAVGRISDITLQSSCQSADESILKVSPSCTSVYLDGSEVRGDQNATILMKYGGTSYQKNFVVWRPELPIDIRVEDQKLSQIKSWKTQLKRKHNLFTSDEELSGDESIDNHLKSNSNKNDYIDTKHNYTPCRPRFQQTRVEMYTKFFSTDHNSGREASLLSRKVSVKVTHLLMPYIRVSDPKVLNLRGNIIEGLSVGLSEVQVVSPITGQLMGSKEIRVASDKETITSIDVKVVTGLELEVKPYIPYSTVWMAKTTLLDKLNTQYQEGLLDVKLHFSDSTSVDLSDISASDYNLSIDTFDGTVAVAPNTGLYPRVIAIGAGKGQLLYLSLEVSNICHRKKTQPLALKYINVNVDFMIPSLQNDAFNYRKNNGVMNTSQTPITDIQYLSSKEKVVPNQYVTIGKPITRKSNINMANIEIGIYSFFAIFGISLLIIAVLYRVLGRAKAPPEAVTTTRIAPITSSNRPIVANANEWVWLGRATLERNSLGTKKPTISQKDLNGNISDNCEEKNKLLSEPVSNRLSELSFAGSDISIRITTNPNLVDDCEPMDETEDSEQNQTQPLISRHMASKQSYMTTVHPPVPLQPPVPARKTRHLPSKYTTYSKPPPIPPHRNIQNLNELNGSKPPPVPPHRAIGVTKRWSNPQPLAANLRVDLPANRVKKCNRNDNNDNLDYNQLLEYFDSLKESNA